MNSLQPVTSMTTVPAAERCFARWCGAMAAAVGLQIAAAFTALIAFMILLVAAFDDLGDRDSTGFPLYSVLSIPVGLGAIAIFVGSGVVASRIVGSRLGWLCLLAGPTIWLVTATAVGGL